MKAAMTLAPVVDQLPPCTIRGRCRWFRQEGKDICLRCPQVATDNAYSAEEMRIVADPNVVLE
jgi:hypothetical protein